MHSLKVYKTISLAQINLQRETVGIFGNQLNIVTQKSEVHTIDGTPEKRIFWSIISDYGLKTGLCELIDNSIDYWMSTGKNGRLTIKINLDAERQLISVIDNAGGVKAENLKLLIAPGGSDNNPLSEVIGLFGVGSKRAGVALGEQVHIRTRYKNEKSFELNVTHEWLQSPDWQLPVYEVPDLPSSSTQVNISHLRDVLTADGIEEIKLHLEETYEWFIQQGCEISINAEKITGRKFDQWAFPPGNAPHKAELEYKHHDGGVVKATITAGLILDRIPEKENYGVYFYCNHRLIAKEVRSREVGYLISGEAGVPHHDSSLCRVIVHMQGPAMLMPWNSSKSAINYLHPVFHFLRPTIIQLTSHFSSLSRRLKNDWEANVFIHTTGNIQDVQADELASKKRLILPPLPRVNVSKMDKLKSRNSKRINDEPWLLGLVEAMGFLDVLGKQKLDTKNRIALILLDSNFEISLKEFIVHETKLFPPNIYNDTKITALFSNRGNVINEVVAKISIPAELVRKAKHYYMMRNKLIHERATVGITDGDVQNYKNTIEAILKILFKLKF